MGSQSDAELAGSTHRNTDQAKTKPENAKNSVPIWLSTFQNRKLFSSSLLTTSKSIKITACQLGTRSTQLCCWLVGCCCFGFKSVHTSERDGLRHTQYGGGFLARFAAGCRRGMERWRWKKTPFVLVRLAARVLTDWSVKLIDDSVATAEEAKHSC